jgi:hypothetical protein
MQKSQRLHETDEWAIDEAPRIGRDYSHHVLTAPANDGMIPPQWIRSARHPRSSILTRTRMTA